MLILFKTKKDQYGNVYYLILDIKNHTFKIDYNIMPAQDAVVLNCKKELNKLENTLIDQGFTRLL